MDQKALKEYLKKISSTIAELANSLDIYAEDEPQPSLREALKNQIAAAMEISNQLDEEILRIAIGK